MPPGIDAYRPYCGGNPAMSANAIDCGTCTSATVTQAIKSAFASEREYFQPGRKKIGRTSSVIRFSASARYTAIFLVYLVSNHLGNLLINRDKSQMENALELERVPRVGRLASEARYCLGSRRLALRACDGLADSSQCTSVFALSPRCRG